ncbi:MAG: hypothetical protein JWO88_3532, partial [Frankiales bacterium]|nr:hypothetical protein [Frankiales bacterium]
VLLVAIATLTGCAQDVPPIACADADFDCFVKQAAAGIKIVRENISYWSNVNLIGAGADRGGGHRGDHHDRAAG